MKSSIKIAAFTILIFCQSAFAIPPLWEVAFNVTELNGTAGGAFDNFGPSGQADGRENIPLGFNFPFGGVNYNRISVDSDGGIVLKNANTTTDILPSVWNKASFQSNFSNQGEPVILPFSTELDQVGSGGRVWYASYNGNFNGFTGFRGVITWVSSAFVFFGAADITFQAILLDDGTIIFNYLALTAPGASWNTKTTEGFVSGVSNGDGTWPQGSQNLNVGDFGIDLTGYQIWCANDDPVLAPSCMQAGLGRNGTFDLHDQSVVFNPDGTNGFLVSSTIKDGTGGGGSGVCAVASNPGGGGGGGGAPTAIGGGGGGGAITASVLFLLPFLPGLLAGLRQGRGRNSQG